MLSTACGSPCYAAPEMIAGKQYKGPMADIWSLGVILFALVCGYLPFEDPNTSMLYRKILAGEYKAPKWISAEVRDLLKKILETDPARRFTINDIRQHVWYNMVSGSAVPKCDIATVDEEEFTKMEVLKIINQMGMDSQLVLDAVASKACNSLSATFYLVAQKEKTRISLDHKQNKSNGVLISNASNRTDLSGPVSRPETTTNASDPRGGGHPPSASTSMNPATARSEYPRIESPRMESPKPMVLISAPVAKDTDDLNAGQNNSPKNLPTERVVLKRPQPQKLVIPKLNIKKQNHENLVIEGQFTSQTARPDSAVHKITPIHQAIVDKTNLTVQTARPLTSGAAVSGTNNPADRFPTVNMNANAIKPTEGLIAATVVAPKPLEENISPVPNDQSDAVIPLNSLLAADIERPQTRRSKSRRDPGAESENAVISEEGPGFGKIPSAPRAPSRSTGSSAGGRRGMHLASAGTPTEDSLPSDKKGVQVVTGGGLLANNILPIETIALAPVSPRASTGSKLNAREQASKNKSNAQGTLVLGQR